MSDHLIAEANRHAKALIAETIALAKWNGALERALKAEASTKWALAERDRAQSEHADLSRYLDEKTTENSEWHRKCREELERAIARAERAEAELATERARLDWFHEAAGDRIWVANQDIRAAIDAAMKVKEDCKV
jgi:hypothetical protein